MKISRKAWAVLLITGLVSAVLLGSPLFRYVIWFEYFRIREHLSRVPFESEPWKGYEREFGDRLRNTPATNRWAYLLPVRLRMVDDLVNRRLLDGKTRQEVLAMLGASVERHYFADWDLVYFLGPGRYGNAIGDSEWLVIRFSPQGTVADYRIVHD